MTDCLGKEIKLVEEADPEFAALILKVINRELPVKIKGNMIYRPTDNSPMQTMRMEALNMPGRNDPCICGSGKKYKKCCGG